MAKRIQKEQTEHDLVVKKSASTWSRALEVHTNLGSEKTYPIKDCYPDVVVKNNLP